MEDRQKHILIAEDNIHLAFSLAFILKVKKYRVTIAHTGKEAVGIIERCQLERTPIDLLISDIQMPDMNGEDVLRFVSERNITVPVLVMTGFREKDVLARFHQLGCKHFIDKPFSQEFFLDQVDRMLGPAPAPATPTAAGM